MVFGLMQGISHPFITDLQDASFRVNIKENKSQTPTVSSSSHWNCQHSALKRHHWNTLGFHSLWRLGLNQMSFFGCGGERWARFKMCRHSSTPPAVWSRLKRSLQWLKPALMPNPEATTLVRVKERLWCRCCLCSSLYQNHLSDRRREGWRLVMWPWSRTESRHS